VVVYSGDKAKEYSVNRSGTGKMGAATGCDVLGQADGQGADLASRR
jgi:hypothetical protein